MSTRSTQLWWFTTAASKPLYESAIVPVGFVWIVKSLYAYNANAAPGLASVWVNKPTGADRVILLEQDLASAGRLSWEGWFVLESGDSLTTYGAVPEMTYMVSGALLPD